MAATDLAASSSLTGAGVVSVCALLFTVASFWWLNARQGRLKTWEPHAFAAIIRSSTARLRLPLVLHNTGAKPIVVQDLLLTFPDASRLQPGPDEDAKEPAGFVVPGREAQQLFIEFEAPFSGFMPEARDFKVQLQARVGHRKGWRRLLTFTLRAANITAAISSPGIPTAAHHPRRRLHRRDQVTASVATIRIRPAPGVLESG